LQFAGTSQQKYHHKKQELYNEQGIGSKVPVASGQGKLLDNHQVPGPE